MRGALVRLAAAMASLGLLSACASSDLVVVLPESDGHVGAVLVGPGPNQTVLDKAYLAARPGPGPVKAFTVDQGRVDREFGPTLAALPAAPATYRLYFKNDSVELVPESRPEFEKVFTDIASRPVPEIVVTGHTDTVGKPADNDLLSLNRARAVSELFAQRGIPRDAITVAGRGERELLIPTADQVAEPRNRRVEITVR
jgi:outer membrane protein OmpA-like peptidoglycan-associated protein